MSSARVVQGLWIHPLRFGQGQAVKEIHFGAEDGLTSWQWLFITEQGAEQGRILTPQQAPKLATVQVLVNDQGLNLGLGKQFFVVPKVNSFKRVMKLTLDSSAGMGARVVEAALEADLFSQALSQYLGVSGRLVRYAASLADAGVELLPASALGADAAAGAAALAAGSMRLVFSGPELLAESGSRLRVGKTVFLQITSQSMNPDQGLLWWPETQGTISVGDSIETFR